MKTTDSSTSPNGSAWRPKRLSAREERRRAEREARKQGHQSNETEEGAPGEEPTRDEPLEP
jgi:hypothetical protein